MIEKTDEQKGKSRLIWIAIVSILILGLFFRFYNIDKKVYWGDETDTGLRVSGYTNKDFKNLISHHRVDIDYLNRFQYPNSEKGILDTIRSLALEEPQHPPLYYVAARLWVESFGNSVWVIRSLSAFLSLLAFPCLYWLCRQLFESRLVAWLAVTLLAVSPVNVLLAQEARQYSLWTVAILLSSAVLLRSLRSNSITLWVIYGTTVVFGMYTHLLFILVVAAHGFYLVAINIKQLRADPIRIPTQLSSYLVFTFGALLAFLPWAFLIIENYTKVSSQLLWTKNNLGAIYLIGQWGFNYSSVFFDAGYAAKYVEGLNLAVAISYLIRVLALLLTAYSIYYLCIKTELRTLLFILALIIIPFIALAFPDLLFGGTRSGNGYRFLIPSYLGVQMAIAFLLASKISCLSHKKRLIWQAIASLLIVSGIVSCTMSSRAESWWTKPNDYWIPQIARKINNAHKPLLIVDRGSARNLLRLTHRLKPDVDLLIVEINSEFEIPGEHTDVFIYEYSPSKQEVIPKISRHSLEEVDKHGLWKIRN